MPVLPDQRHELTETFVLTLSSPTNATLATSQATGSILDTDPLRVTWGDLVAPLDGAADAAVLRPSTQSWHLVDSNAGTASTLGPWGDPTTYGDVPVPADYDGDGTTDFAVYRPAPYGVWYYKPASNPATWDAIGWGGLAGDIPVPGDYDGDGTADVAVYRPSEGHWHIRKSSTQTELLVDWGIAGATVLPTPADYDGDHTTDVAFYYPASGYWYVVPSTTGIAQYISWGLPDAAVKPAPADYDGDGKADLAFLNPADQYWYVVRSTTGQAFYLNWGVGAQDEPVSADYDGDGLADVAFYEPVGHTFYIVRSTTGQALYVPVPNATAADIPVLRRPR